MASTPCSVQFRISINLKSLRAASPGSSCAERERVRSAAELLPSVSIMTEANYRKHHALTEGLARPRGRAMKLTYFEVMAKGLG